MKKIFFLTVLMIFSMPGHAMALNVGIAPPIIDFGQLEPGTEISGTFYIYGAGAEEFSCDIMPVKVPTKFYYPDRPRNGYVFDVSRASEEDVSEWINLLEKSVTVPKESYFVPEINAKVNRKIDFILNIPEDAEPGYHVGYILPSPKVSVTSTGGVGIGIISTIKATYLFTVPGDVIREVQILGFDYKRLDEKYEEIIVLVKNTGTVTTSVKLENIVIDEGKRKTTLTGTSHKKTEPNQIIELKAKYSVADKEEGEYKATARISWLTGEEEKDGIIEILKYQKPVTVTGDVIAPPGPPAGFPFWTAPMFIILFAIVIYWWRNDKS